MMLSGVEGLIEFETRLLKKHLGFDCGDESFGTQSRQLTPINNEDFATRLEYSFYFQNKFIWFLDLEKYIRGDRSIGYTLSKFCSTDLLDIDVIPPELADIKEWRIRIEDDICPQSLEEVEMSVISRTLQKNNGNRAVTAEILGIDKSTLWRKIKQYKIE